MTIAYTLRGMVVRVIQQPGSRLAYVTIVRDSRRYSAMRGPKSLKRLASRLRGRTGGF